MIRRCLSHCVCVCVCVCESHLLAYLDTPSPIRVIGVQEGDIAISGEKKLLAINIIVIKAENI